MTKPKELLKNYQSILEPVKNPPPPGSVPLKNHVHEAYCRYRAQALPRFIAYREAAYRHTRGKPTRCDPKDVDVTTVRLEKKPHIVARIQHLTQNAISQIAVKRMALEQQLWGIHSVNLQDYYERYEEVVTDKNGNPATNEDGTPKVRTRERPRLLTELPPELAALVEDVTIDAKGRAIPKLYNKLQANKELRAMLEIGRASDGKADVSRLSDAELVQQLADQAKALGVNIDLNYRFATPRDTPAGSDSSQAVDMKDITPREPATDNSVDDA